MVFIFRTLTQIGIACSKLKIFIPIIIALLNPHDATHHAHDALTTITIGLYALHCVSTYMRSHPYDGLYRGPLVLIQALRTGREVGILEQGAAFPARTTYRVIVRLLSWPLHSPVTPAIIIIHYLNETT